MKLDFSREQMDVGTTSFNFDAAGREVQSLVAAMQASSMGPSRA